MKTNYLKSKFYIWRKQTRIYLAQYPRIFFPLRLLLYGFVHERLIAKDTEIVIEGFPSSANSFAVKAFEMSQPHQVKIAHHLHDPAAIIAAAKSGIPCILLIRDPEDAIMSYLIRFISQGETNLNNSINIISNQLNKYIDFYSSLIPYQKEIIVADFSEVISDFGQIITKLNHKFGTNFQEFIHNESNVDKCFKLIEKYNSQAFGKGKVVEKSVARPSEYRKKLKQQLSIEFKSSEIQNLGDCAYEVYNCFQTEKSSEKLAENIR
ncbi:conserved hypothetical protein [Hyella patelloides LEGE 07179]|uniref:Sulfotransferase domain-containing protein n=1 Tax=Hyella patelloides LEGE 07179 TaxID=945734 RepID=A0A563VMK5_9CYAN|nr:hypothetical protein [Hyella patelloides]VEP12686.1 conserved hypothetical protein [Hyella patelloides LEGE 07179]